MKKSKGLSKNNQNLLNDINNVKMCLQEFESKNRDEYITTKIEKNTIKRIEEEICKRLRKP